MEEIILKVGSKGSQATGGNTNAPRNQKVTVRATVYLLNFMRKNLGKCA